MPGLASNAEAAKSWNLAKKCLAAGDVHAGYAAFSTAKRLLDEQVQTILLHSHHLLHFGKVE